MAINTDSQLVNMQKIQDFGVLSPKRDTCTNTLPSQLRDHGGRGDGKMLRVDYLKEAVFSRHNRQGLPKFKPGKIS